MADITPATKPADSPWESQYLKQVYDRFGRDETVLLPAKDGSKVSVNNCQPALRSQIHPDYQWALETNDTAVLCGPASLHLAFIRFSDDSQRQEFLKQNPALSKTLLTSCPGHFAVWVRLDRIGGQPERGHEHPVCSFYTEGFAMVASRSRNSPYRFDNDGTPVKIRTQDIVWPGKVAIHRNVLAVSDKHPKIIFGKAGSFELDDDFIVETLKAQVPTLTFDPDTNEFYYELEGVASGPLLAHPEHVKKALHGALTHMRKELMSEHLERNPPWLTSVTNETNPSGRTEPPPVYVDTSPKHLKTLLELFKIRAVRGMKPANERNWLPNGMSEEASIEHLNKFINGRLELVPGESITITEAYSGYLEFCEAEDVQPLTLSQFRKRVGEGVLSAFSVEKNHSTLRNGKCQRGFRNLRVKCKDRSGKESVPGQLGTLGTDRTPDFESLSNARAN